MPGTGGYKPPKPTAPSWWQSVKAKLKEMTNIAAQGTIVPKGTVRTTPKPPAWYTPQMSNYVMPTKPNPYNATPPKPKTTIPTGSFIGGGGTSVLTSVGAMPLTIPTSSVLGGGGQYVVGPNRQAYPRNPSVNSTFLAAQGQAVRGPDVPIADVQQPDTSSGGYGYEPYKKRRGGGGGGSGGGDYGYTPREQNVPAWARGLANWSIG